MNAVVFDTLQLSRRLEAAGFTAQQAQGAAAALSETLGERLASQRDVQDVNLRIDAVHEGLKRDIEQLRQEVKRDIEDLRQEVQRDIADLRQEVKRDIADLRQEVKQDITDLRQEMLAMEARLRAEMRERDQRQTIRLGTMMAGAILLVGALVKLL